MWCLLGVGGCFASGKVSGECVFDRVCVLFLFVLVAVVFVVETIFFCVLISILFMSDQKTTHSPSILPPPQKILTCALELAVKPPLTANASQTP